MNTKSRHAYCIIAHTDEYCLQKLIQCLDDNRNDIFILFDKKSNLFKSSFHTLHSKITIIPKEESIDIRWGAYSQIEAEIKILKTAKKQGNYEYYHLISGQDLPIKSQDNIHSFFRMLPPGTNLVGFKDYTSKEKRNVLKRVVPYHFFKNNLRPKNKLRRLFHRSIEEISSHIQRILRMRISKKIEYRKGCNWVSITETFVNYLIEQEKYTQEILGKAIICDELYIQTIIWNSKFRHTAFNYEDEYTGCMREIDWKRGKPYTWKSEDFDYLINSDRLFARKFSSAIDKNIINQISDFVSH